MNYSYERAEEKLKVKPKRFVLSEDKKNLIEKRLARYALEDGEYASKVL